MTEKHYYCPRCGKELFPTMTELTLDFECSCGWWRNWTGGYDNQCAKKEEIWR